MQTLARRCRHRPLSAWARLGLLMAFSAQTACARTLDVPAIPSAELPRDYVAVTSCAQSQHPARDHVITWIDRGAESQWRTGKGPLPVGTRVVKVQYADVACRELTRYTAMQKGPPGTAPATGDWIWQLLDKRRGVRQHGQLSGCISCHRVCEDDDWLCTWPAPEAASTAPAPPQPVPEGW